MKKVLRISSFIAVISIFLLLNSTSVFAVHKGAGGLTCGMCHTMHNSQGNTAFVGSQTPGALIMLRADVSGRQDVHKLCLQCHASNGANADNVYEPHTTIKPPKVYIDGASGHGIAANGSDPFDFTKIGAGGDFSATFTYNGSTITYATGDDPLGPGGPSLGHGHSLGATNVTPPGGGVALVAFSCTSCHDPHGRNTTQGSSDGVNLYRMLRYNTTGATIAPASNPITGMHSWVGGISGPAGTGNYAGVGSTGATHIWPVAIDAANQNVYAAGSVAGNQASGTAFSNFCTQCHVDWHEANSTGNVSGDDWKRHPVDNAILDTTPNSGAGVAITRYANYNTNVAPSLLARDTTTGATKLPAMQATSAGATYYADDSSDRVFCLSCHYAHGGPNYDILRWSHTSEVTAGNQKGNSIPLNVGCQQCHNR